MKTKAEQFVKILNSDELSKYYPGMGCECHAFNRDECGCDVDWTSREVYELRLALKTIMDEYCPKKNTLLCYQRMKEIAKNALLK